MFLFQQSTIQKDIKKVILLTTASKRIKYLEINLTKEMKDLHSENCKTLLNEIKEDLTNWKDIPCSWKGGLNIVKMSVLLKAVYKYNTIPTRITTAFFHRNRATNPQIHVELQGPQIARTILKKKNKVGGLKLPNFETQYKATVIGTVWNWLKDRHIDHWNRRENPEVNPHM